MSEQAADIITYNSEKKTTSDYILLIGGWLVSCISLAIICLIAYWAIKIPENNINKLPIINAIKGDLRVEPDKPGGKSFNDEDLSIYKNLENSPTISQKNEIMLNKTDENLTDLRKQIKTNEFGEGDQKNLTLAIEDALKEVVNGHVDENNLSKEANQRGNPRLYLGSFDSLSQADEFKKFIKKRNNTLIDIDNLKIFEKFENEKEFFTVELMNIDSEEEGSKLCSLLSSRQFSCLLLN